MGLKLQLLKDGKVIYQMPLTMDETEVDVVLRELGDFDEDLSRIQAFHDLFSSETRIRMLQEMVRGFGCRFSELMEALDANQKIISENLRRMSEMRLVKRVEKHPREVQYRPSPLGMASFLACIAMRRIMEEIEEVSGE